MKILIDINHPAHVHYYRNFYSIMLQRGHEVLVISRNKEIEHYLLNSFNIPFIDRGKGSNSKFGKVFYFVKAIILISKYISKFKADIIMSFGTPYPAIAGWLLRVPHISFSDTEHAKIHHLLTDPFSKHIVTPSCYTKNLGEKQIRFDGFMELCYLHPNYFKPDKSILNYLGVKKNELYIIFRFIAWNAIHDVGQTGLSLEEKRALIKEISKFAKVFISSENKLPKDLERYQIKIPPEKIHDALYYSTMFIGESGTMASECAMLGTPAFFISSLTAGTLEEQKNINLLFMYKNVKGVIKKALELLTTNGLKEEFQARRKNMLQNKIDVTAFMVWFVENYPESTKIMKENPDYQDRFK